MSLGISSESCRGHGNPFNCQCLHNPSSDFQLTLTPPPIPSMLHVQAYLIILGLSIQLAESGKVLQVVR